MSILGRTAGRALAGAGSGMSAVASKYIDENLMAQRAERLAELQRSTALQTEKDIDAFRNTPERLERDRQAKVKDVEAESAARLAADRARAADPALRQANITTAEETARAAERVRREEAIKSGTDQVYLKAQKAIASATRVPESSLAVAQADLVRLQTADLKRLGHLYDQVEAISNDTKMTPAERDAKLKPIVTGIQTIKAKTSTAVRDPELDTVTITEERMNPDGTVSKTTRKEVRRPGAEKGGSSEFADLDALLPPKKPKDGAKSGDAPKPRVPMAERAQQDPIGAMDDRTLERIAGIQGHANQQKAREELQRRRAAQPPIDPTGFGYGSTP